MAALIGKTNNPAAKAWLRPLLDDTHAEVVIGALKGLSLIGGEDVTSWAAEILGDGGRGESVRIAAAVALGTIHTPASRDALAAAFAGMPGEEIATEILNGLGRYPFGEVAPVFQDLLAAPDAPEDLRATAVEALALSTREAVPFLLDRAGGDGSEDVRAMAAWAISAHEDETRLGAQLTAMAEKEAEPDVRRRLYEALLPQAEIPAARLLPKVMAEEDPAARIAGFNALGRAARLAPTSPEAADFDSRVVPELQRAASGTNSMNLRMRAVFGLRRAGTPAAVQALQSLSGHSDKTIATAASNGLRAASSRKP
jgi:HEAT repeat protein